MPTRAPLFGTTLDNWLNRLDAEGFRVGMRERLIVQDFLTRLAARGELPESHAAALQLIAPLICTTPETQRHYAALLKDFLTIKSRRLRRKRARAEARRQASTQRPRRGWLIGLIGLVMLVAAVSAGLWWWHTQPAPPKETTPPPVAGQTGGQAIPNSNPQALDVYRPPQPLPMAVPDATAGLPPPFRIAAWLIAGLSALLLAWAAWARLRRALYLQGTRTDTEVEEHVLTDPQAGQIEPQAAQIRVASRGLRQRVAGEREVLDLHATLAATLRAAGAFSPRYRLLQHTPEYLALIDRRHPGDHLAAYSEALLKALAEHGVTVQVYTFAGSPDQGCWRLRQGTAGREVFDRASIVELAARYGGHRLLIFAEADALVDPLTGGSRRWAGQLGVFPQRAWFTPMPMQSWGGAEETADAQGFLVLPMPAEALTTLAGWFSSGDLSLAAGADWPLAYPGLLKDQAVAWVARQSPPPEEMLRELLYQLRAYLGAQRYQWLCACAIFPALSPVLTLALGKELNVDARELTLGMATLGALPWFRHGRMPAWLRESLLTELNPENEARYRQVIEQRLSGALEGTTGAELARVATRRKLLAWFSRGRGPARDVVLVDFLYRDSLSRLAQVLPEPLRQRLFRNGLAIHGLRPALLASLAGLFALSLGLALYVSFKPPAPSPATPVQSIPIHLIGCPDSGGVDAATRSLADVLARLSPAQLGMTGTATRIAPTAYTPAKWAVLNGQPAPPIGEIRFGTGNAGQINQADKLRDWLRSRKSGSATGTWTLQASQGGLAAPAVNVCAPQPSIPRVDTAPADAVNVYIQIGDQAQRFWADQIVERLRRIPLVIVQVELVDLKRLPDRIEIRSRNGGNPGFIKHIADELSGSLGTPAVTKALQLLKGDRLKGNVYEIWASNRLCLQDTTPACGPGATPAKPVNIRKFLAARATIAPGEQDKLCYAVDNAERLSLTPGPGTLKNRVKDCVAVTPTRTTAYTLTAQGQNGAPVGRVVTVQVRETAGTVQVPALTKLPVGQASDILAKLGLKAEQIALTGPTRALPGTVLDQKPPAGSAVPAGSVVTLGVVTTATVPETGWCCILGSASQHQQGGVFSLDKKTCLGRDGVFYRDENQALSECRGFAGLETAPDIPSGWERVDVAEVQGLLAKAGFYKGPMDGVVRDELTKALMRFQDSNRLVADGLPGARTLSILRGERNPPNPPAQLQFKK